MCKIIAKIIMTVYVDNSRLSWRGKSWCHLVADSIAELHAFAEQLGLKREWFQDKTMYPHYDVTVRVQQRALALGAQVGDKRTIITCAKRLRKELSMRGESCESFGNYSRDELVLNRATKYDEHSQQLLFGG